MNNDLISREALRESFKAWKNMDDYYHDTDCDDIPLSEAYDLIDNAPTVFDDKAYSDGYAQGTCDCEHAHEIPQGEWVRKEDVIQSIAKQYSEHNELVPIWLRIGDLKGGTE